MTFAIIAAIILFSVRKSLTDDDEFCCAPRFVDDVRDCDNVENLIFNEKELIMGLQTDDEESGLRLSGTFHLLKDFDDDQFEFEVVIEKLTPLGKEYMYGSCLNGCASLKEEDAPWSPLFGSLNISGCPALKGKYNIPGVIIDLDFLKPLMKKHEYCGEYEVQLLVTRSLEKLQCIIVTMEIYEKE